jgi:hypothetical protein
MDWATADALARVLDGVATFTSLDLSRMRPLPPSCHRVVSHRGRCHPPTSGVSPTCLLVQLHDDRRVRLLVRTVPYLASHYPTGNPRDRGPNASCFCPILCPGVQHCQTACVLHFCAVYLCVYWRSQPYGPQNFFAILTVFEFLPPLSIHPPPPGAGSTVFETPTPWLDPWKTLAPKHSSLAVKASENFGLGAPWLKSPIDIFQVTTGGPERVFGQM